MDAVQIFPPGASQLASAWASAIQLGSWIMADPGPDYGAKGLIESVESQNALRDGGTFAHRRGTIRKMALPLMINTPSPVMWESSLRRAVTPGAIVSVQPEGVPSSQAVYFDIIDGRWEPDYNIFHNRVGVRKGTLYLDTQPWGYWPTEILLASSASVGYLGQLAVNGASVIGDVPPLAHVIISPTVASAFGGSYIGATWAPDMLALSFAARASFSPFIPAASFLQASFANFAGNSNAITGGLVGDKFAPGSQAIQLTVSGTVLPLGFNMYADSNLSIPSALEPAYRGRFRVFSFMRLGPSVIPWRAIIDSDNYWGGALGQALASSNLVATVYSFVASDGANGVSPSPAYSTLDMGEITLPARGSGYGQGVRMRLWMSPASNLGLATQQLSFAGLYLLPLDGAAGVLSRGLVVPSLTNYQTTLNQGGAEFNRNFVDSVLVTTPANGVAVSDARANYHGVTPRLSATTSQLVFLTGDRLAGYAGTVGAVFVQGVGATYPVAQGNVEYAQVSVSYRPTFQFLYGL